jgi:hypothetical protein
MAQQTPNKPLATFKVKGIQISVWRGKTGPTWTMRKSYKDKKTDSWVEAKSFFMSEAMDIITLLQQMTDQYSDESNPPGYQSESNIDSPPKMFDEPTTQFEDDDIPF